MKQKYNIGAIILFLVCLAVTVILFPVACDNEQVYEAILLTSIAIVVFIMLFLLKINLIDS